MPMSHRVFLQLARRRLAGKEGVIPLDEVSAARLLTFQPMRRLSLPFRLPQWVTAADEWNHAEVVSRRR